MNLETIELEIIEQDSIAIIRLNRPKALNSLNPQLAKDFVEVVNELDGNPNVRAVIVTGNGKAFSAGGDLMAFKSSDNPKQFLYDLAEMFHRGIIKLRNMDAPFIAAINGPCFGVGLSLATACDFRIAVGSAKFSVAFTGVGLAPDSSLPYFLPKIVGISKATEMALLNTTLTAEDALKCGLINGIASEPENLLEEAKKQAIKLARMPTKALGLVKRMYNDSYCDSLEEHLEKELKAVSATAATEDFQEGCAAFFEKRRPNFKGK
ncbi:MAG: enoyl-CoA hydratase/isomerase family protein [Candidatus Hodarchaeota archaeon]